MYLVIGATGRVGRHVVDGLLAAGEQVRALTRDPSRAGLPPSAQVVQGDLGDPAALRTALAGVRGVHVGMSPDALGLEPNVAEAVGELGVARVVKLSSVAANPPVSDSYGRAHAAAEDAFRASGAEWTFLRPAGFMTNVLQWRGSITSQGKVLQPYGDVGRAMIDPADVAACSVACLTRPGHGGKIYQLTGPEALTAPQATDRVAKALGTPLEFVGVDPEQARAGMTRAGMPADLVDGLLSAMAEAGPLRGGVPRPDVELILGRAPATLDSWLSRNVSELR